MADKLTDAQVADLLTILRSDSSLDAKVQFVTVIKSAIKQHNVPESCVAQLFDGLRTASSAQHAALVNAGFTALNHLLTRLSRQDPKLLAREAARTLPLVIEKLGDQKDKYRSLAAQALNTLYVASSADAERFVRNSALAGKNPRAKEGGMHWLLQVNTNFPYRCHRASQGAYQRCRVCQSCSVELTYPLTFDRLIRNMVCLFEATFPYSWNFSKMPTAWFETLPRPP